MCIKKQQQVRKKKHTSFFLHKHINALTTERMLPFSIYEFLFITVGILFAGYKSLLAAESKDENGESDRKQWLTYWAVTSFFCFLDAYFITSWYNYWLYIDFRAVLMIWMVKSNGAEKLCEMGLAQYVKTVGEKASVVIEGLWDILRRTVPIDKYYSYVDKYLPLIFKKVLGLQKEDVAATISDITQTIKKSQANEALVKKNNAMKAEKEQEEKVQKDISINATDIKSVGLNLKKKNANDANKKQSLKDVVGDAMKENDAVTTASGPTTSTISISSITL